MKVEKEELEIPRMSREPALSVKWGTGNLIHDPEELRIKHSSLPTKSWPGWYTSVPCLG